MNYVHAEYFSFACCLFCFFFVLVDPVYSNNLLNDFQLNSRLCLNKISGNRAAHFIASYVTTCHCY